MSEQFEPDPLDELRAADPVDVDRLSSASLARIRARVSEDVMTTDTARRTPWVRRVFGLAAGLGSVVALALVLVFRGGGAAPGVVPGGSIGSVPTAAPSGSIGIGTGSASCVEPYTKTALRHRSFAFDGTISAISGERVTFTVNRAYRGAIGTTITLDAPGMTGTAITSAGGPNLSIGTRYLVAGDDHFVWACGYTQPYDAAIAAEWAATLGAEPVQPCGRPRGPAPGSCPS